jgi:integrase
VSIHKRNGKFQVKWTEPGNQQRSKTFTRKGDAETWDRERQRRQQLGPAYARTLEPITLEQFLATPAWLDIHGRLSKSQRDKYLWAFEKHLADLLDASLPDIDVPRLAVERTRMRDAGASVTTRSTVLGLLARVLDQAVLHGRIPGNPARALPGDERRTPTEVKPLSPVELERLLVDLVAEGVNGGRGRGGHGHYGINVRHGRRAYVLGLLGGHLGLSPVEIRSVPWHALRDGQLHIRAEDTKASRAHPRAIDLPRATELALKEWRIESGGRGADPIVGAMTERALVLWGKNTLRRHVERITDGRVDDASTYTLRHSHASALHHVAGWTLATAAHRLGHTQQTHIKHYSHIIDAIRGERYADLDALIGAARAAVAPTPRGRNGEGQDDAVDL